MYYGVSDKVFNNFIYRYLMQKRSGIEICESFYKS